MEKMFIKNYPSPQKIKMTKFVVNQTKKTPPGGLEPPTFRLTAERASQLRHGGLMLDKFLHNV